MARQMKSGDTAMARLIARALRALAGNGAGTKSAKENEPLRMSDVHPPGSCARNWRPPDFSDLFAPETPDVEKNRR